MKNILLILTIFYFSCNKKNVDPVSPSSINPGSSTIRISRIHYYINGYSDYKYNSSGVLTKIETKEDHDTTKVDYSTNLLYENDKIIVKSFDGTNKEILSDKTTFYFDKNNKLIRSEDQEGLDYCGCYKSYLYDSQQQLIKIESNSVNSSGQIKMFSYEDFIYDNSGNIIKATNIQGANKTILEMSYDSKPNPFKNNIISFILNASISHGGVQGYFSNNNPENGKFTRSGSNNDVTTFKNTYVYNSAGYPIKITSPSNLSSQGIIESTINY
jgi:hypothetical protein